MNLFSGSQCKPSRGRKRGICWCVDKYGVQLPGTDYSGGDIQCKDLENSNNSEWKWGGPPSTTQPPPPIRNHHMTQGPCLLSDPHLYTMPTVHPKIEEKRKKKSWRSRQKRQLQICSFIFCCWPSTHLLIEEGCPRWFTKSGHLLGHLLPSRSTWIYMHSTDIF